MNKYLSTACVLSLSGLLFVSCGQPVEQENSNDTSVPTQNIVLSGGVLPDSLRISSPEAGSLVQSPVTITGEAAGWYFEGSFPISVVDADGNTLGQGYATSLEDWMTSEFVPFSAEVSFMSGNATSGAIVLTQSNPSGIERDDLGRYELPVRFAEQIGQEITLYFNSSTLDPEMSDCSNVFPVKRALVSSQDITKDAMGALLGGPNENEVANGYFSSIPKEAQLKTISLQNRTLTLDFNEGLSAGGSCQVQSIRAQIEETAKALGIADNVLITVQGSATEALQP